MEQYNYNNLCQFIGKKVQLKDAQENEIELTITEVNKGQLDGDEWEVFSVIYQGDKNVQLPQGTYTFSHDSFGEKILFLSPNSPMEYETVVSRKKQ